MGSLTHIPTLRQTDLPKRGSELLALPRHRSSPGHQIHLLIAKAGVVRPPNLILDEAQLHPDLTLAISTPSSSIPQVQVGLVQTASRHRLADMRGTAAGAAPTAMQVDQRASSA